MLLFILCVCSMYHCICFRRIFYYYYCCCCRVANELRSLEEHQELSSLRGVIEEVRTLVCLFSLRLRLCCWCWCLCDGSIGIELLKQRTFLSFSFYLSHTEFYFQVVDEASRSFLFFFSFFFPLGLFSLTCHMFLLGL